MSSETDYRDRYAPEGIGPEVVDMERLIDDHATWTARSTGFRKPTEWLCICGHVLPGDGVGISFKHQWHLAQVLTDLDAPSPSSHQPDPTEDA